MVYRIFKLIVPHTNKRNLELTLLQQVNTLQTLRYLADRGIDDRINNMPPQLMFKELITEPPLRHLLTGWCIDDNFSMYLSHEYEQDDFTDNGVLLHFNCSEVKLGSRWNKYKIESASFLSTDLETNRLLEDLIHPAFGMVKGIIGHIWNDDQVYVFIYLEWLEYLKKLDDLLGCPLYCLQHICNNS
ncbi:24171_t:CDS:2 [Gigaspora margarita]|uniref:24171_t:CDS:1 n=1 Tax=Gigaspora margarita TaxID=4874 RepID=A0ABM8W6N7_GIGMA|nr:24171_t:CDS:2 [Gigaspora margarita]